MKYSVGWRSSGEIPAANDSNASRWSARLAFCQRVRQPRLARITRGPDFSAFGPSSVASSSSSSTAANKAQFCVKSGSDERKAGGRNVCPRPPRYRWPSLPGAHCVADLCRRRPDMGRATSPSRRFRSDSWVRRARTPYCDDPRSSGWLAYRIASGQNCGQRRLRDVADGCRISEPHAVGSESCQIWKPDRIDPARVVEQRHERQFVKDHDHDRTRRAEAARGRPFCSAAPDRHGPPRTNTSGTMSAAGDNTLR